jgi:glycosyltransferase involved in cell wall biosynthesis
MNNIAVITIGRNEGDRLINCLLSLKKELPENTPIIYIDSGSGDDSINNAKKQGAIVIELDMSIPFTAARARNKGFEYILQNYPETEYIQFLDGDCEILTSWLHKSIERLNNKKDLAIVCGRNIEKYLDKSIYNRLADMEWNTLIGETNDCGGNILIRLTALKDVNGYNPQLICAEDSEMCLRLIRKGWKIERLDVDMALHDAAMYKFQQWWKRSVRGGWANAEGYALYGNAPEKYRKKEHFSGYLWGFIVPLLSLSLLWFTHGLSLLFCLGYILLFFKIYRYRLQKFNDTVDNARLYAFWCTFSKFPQFIGQCTYWWKRLRNKQATLIEYK